MKIVYVLLFVSNISITFSTQVFEDAGAHTGIEFWDVLGPLPTEPQRSDEGALYTNGAYIALDTIYLWKVGERGVTRERVSATHYWLGSNVSDDIKEAAAKYGMELWNKGERNGPFYRQAEGYEAETFKNLFSTEPHDRMYLVKGEKEPWIEEIPLSDEQPMNSDDLYVYDTTAGILIYNDRKHTLQEEKAAEALAYRLQKEGPNDRGIFDAKRDNFPNLKPTTITDAEYEKGRIEQVKLFKLIKCDTVRNGCISKLEEVQCSKPFSLSILDIKECYVLDSKSLSGVFVWVGKNVEPLHYEECMVHGEELFQQKEYKYPATVTIMKQGQETTQFLMQFYPLTKPSNASELKDTPTISDEDPARMSAEKKQKTFDM